MPVTTILLLRHGYRLSWILNPSTGEYTATHPFPTKLPADPPLASHGVRQAHETGVYLHKTLLKVARNDQLRIYSSLFYRCLETLRPAMEKLRAEFSGDAKALRSLEVRGERGIGEWFGHAWFEQPAAGSPEMLRERFFPWVDARYESLVIPHRHGERINNLHERVARMLQMVVKDVDREYEEMGRGEESVTLLICGHAAQIICSGRVLTGQVPDDLDEDDFKCFTCGISKFVRRQTDSAGDEETSDWRRDGVAGGWDCVLNSDCGHLSGGEEKGWHFHGDESFDSYGAGLSQEPITSNGVLGPTKEATGDSNEGLNGVSKL